MRCLWGGDTDTIAAIAGAMAEAFFGIPDELKGKVYGFLNQVQVGVLERFDWALGENK